ncbi:mitochondrial uncoupling protein 2-like [Limulus polyphemus]|uniref:Mitochondrial uncoupling protein 2-like n=1 Tax=Limulus polyphemus TaxID=6850 RepID=A0ABM1B678_LIMPO|nr:mitochondrial uncoupling protein 2-like [Limulus polyphemus]
MVGIGATKREPTVVIKFFSAGTAACIADSITFPLDVAKVRLQIQGEGNAPVKITGNSFLKTTVTPKYRGMLGTLTTIARQEGPKSLYNGLCAGLQRQMAFASVRIGLYDSIRSFYQNLLSGPNSQAGVGIRIMAGITSGGMAVICAQPTDVVKVRMQAQVSGQPKRYTGALQAYRMIGREEGMKGLWKGTLPNVTRNAVVNASELVAYDAIKELIINRRLMTDNAPCHFVSAFGAGFCATVIASPVDVVKTRFMNSWQGQYSGALDCAVKMLREGGFLSFYKGFFPSFIRLGSWNICMFVTFEQLKRLCCLMGDKELFSHTSIPAPGYAPVLHFLVEPPSSTAKVDGFYKKRINQWDI